MGRKPAQFVVVTKKDNPNFIRMFASFNEAIAMTGPEYDKLGYVITNFERKTETYFSKVEVEKPETDDTPLFDKGNNGQLSQ